VIPTRVLQSETLRFWTRGALVILFAQIFLGGWTSTNYAALACTDFPTCHGAWFPEMDFGNAFHWLRELGEGADGQALPLAAYTAIYLAWLGLRLINQPQLKKLTFIMLALLIAQIALGIANLLLHLPLVLAVGHNMGAALLLITVVVINSKITGLKS
jgi:cytochrome c oxidase assembly protein subunit 15